MKPVRLKKCTLSLPLVAMLLALAPGCSRLSADPVEPEVIYGELMCTCGGCNQTLGECSHIGCPNATPMRAEVDRYLEEGVAPQGILNLFAEKYGLSVLAAPPTAGWFNVAAWVIPFLALSFGLGLVGIFARRFRNRWTAPAKPASVTGNADFKRRLEEELADFTPED